MKKVALISSFCDTQEKQVKITYKDIKYDITDIINQIKHNTFRLA
jgi:hypothetical protein